VNVRSARTAFFIFLWTASPLSGQATDEESYIENQEENDATGWIDWFQTLRTEPLDLNRASFETLRTLPLISPAIAKRLVDERKRGGSFRSWTDFISRMGLSASFAEALEPYVVMSKGRERTVRRTELRARVRRQFPAPAGFGSGSYRGSPLHTTMRVKTSQGGRFSAGFLFEKDAGETAWNDHAVGFVEIRDSRETLRAVLGHFFLEAGQGLVFWGPYGMFKGGDPVDPVEKRPLSGKGYLYAAEQAAYRGALVQKRSRSVTATVFVSKAPLDGTPCPDGSVGSTICTGYHRTASECKRRGTLTETVFGARLEVSNRLLSLGISGFTGRYSRTVSGQDFDRNRFDFSGNLNHVLGLDWNGFWKNVHWTGELARNRSGGEAAVASCSIDWSPIKWIGSIRSYAPDFQNPHGSGFAAFETQNERGFYVGFSAKLDRHTRMGLYADLVQRPWRTYTVPVPTRAEDVYLRLDRVFPRLVSLSLRIRLRLSETDTAVETGSMPWVWVTDRSNRNIRLDVRFVPFHEADARMRLNWISLVQPVSPSFTASSGKRENGCLFYQEIRFRPVRAIRLSARLSVFQTDSYDSRVYSFESDLDGIHAVPMFYGRGNKWHLLLAWTPSKRFKASAKIARTTHIGVSSWGTGSDRVAGNAETDVGLQLDWAF